MSANQGALQDLNDLAFFAAVVEHGGFSAAGRALGVPKSRLSKRVAQLEERLGVRLLERTTRRFVVTDVGQRFYEHCRTMLEAARAAQDAVDALSAEPRGIVRVSCPVSLAETLLAAMLPDFLTRYPKVEVRLAATDRRVDLINEGFDIAIRVRSRIDADSSLVARTFGQSSVLPVASPGLLDELGRPADTADLARLPALSMYEHDGVPVWSLVDDDDVEASIEMRTRLVCGNFSVLLAAARRGLGVALLPEFVSGPAIARGELEVVLPGWRAPQGVMHFVYSGRRGLLPGVRALVDFLAERLPAAVRKQHEDCRAPRRK